MLSAAQIIAENALPGTPESEWDIFGTASANIQGYAVQFSVDHGQTVQFKVDTNTAQYRLDIYRMGWYQGLGARKVATIHPNSSVAQNQPTPLVNHDLNMTDASNWAVSAQWAVPSNAVSGVYMAKLVREDGTFGENQILFVVRDDEGHSDILFQTSDETWEAYNTWGGSSLYTPNYPAGRALAVSYNRPFANLDSSPLNYYFAEEYPMTRFLERNGYDVSYFAGIDSDRFGSEILEHKAFLSVGHDEYWSGNQRDNVEAARDAGVNLSFMSGNEVFWKTRFATDPTGNPYGTLICYKETLAGAKIDPLSDTWTGTWRDPRFASSTDGGHPENSLTGTIFTVNSNGDLGTTIDVQSEFAALRFWRNTEVASLTGNQSVSLGDRALGYEWDEDLDNGYRPAGLFDLSSTTRNVAQYLLDYGATYGKGTATHSMTEYRAASGALVFSAGSIQYAWALDDLHSVYQTSTDPALQQATINLFADMGAQPGSLMAGMIRATQSTDLLAPISTILSPLTGASFASGTDVTIRGNAQDRGGGVVAVVEVSVDGGITWHRATGRESWTYTFTTRGNGPFSILSRAADDSGNVETNPPRVDVNPILNPGVYSFWSDSDTPGTLDSKDKQAIEVGVRFVSDTNGTITGIRFYKTTTNIGTHIANLWTSTGQLLATATFTNETGSGWQQVNFDTPVSITAGVSYIASYFAPNGHYSSDNNYFTTEGISYGPLHANPTGPSGTNGVYRYGNSSGFPTLTYQNTNYWVDVVLNTVPNNDHTAPTVDSFSAADGTTQLTTDSAIVIKFDEALNPASINTSTVQLLNPDPNSIPGGCCSTPGGWCSGCPLVMGANTKTITASLKYDPTLHTITVTPVAPLSASTIYTVVVLGGASGVKDMAGNAVANDTAQTFLTPDHAATIVSNVFSSTTTPTTVDGADTSSIEVGMKFTADADGFITGIRFYKSALNTGVHVANLWTSSGQLVATATFANETATGWQQVNFDTPVSITAGTTYVASYHTNSGHYSADTNYFASAVDTGMLNVPANGGVYSYGSGQFPSLTYKSTNYWVDVVLHTVPPQPQQQDQPPEVTATTPAAGTTNVAVNAAPTVTFSEAVDPTSITAGTVKLFDGGNNFVPSTLSYNASTMTVTLTPLAPLAFNNTYSIVITGGPTGIKDTFGNALQQTFQSTFTTVAAATTDTTPPTVVSVNPSNGATNVSPTSVFKVTFSEGLNAATIDISRVLLLKNATNRVTASVSYDAATKTVTTTPAAALDPATNYTIYILGGMTGVRDLSGNAMTSDLVSAFTTAAPTVTSSLWPNTTTPGTVDIGEAAAVNLGVKFTADTSGYITGVRFYKSAANTGTHVGQLWSSTGQLLATATFTSETASGWQTVTFSNPVAITAGTTYVASYLAPNGHFAVNRSAFTSAFTSGHLTVPANGGVFTYGTAAAFPTQTNLSSNYWVDVTFAVTPPADTTAPTVTSTSPASGATNIAIGAAATVTFSEAVDPATVSNSTVKILDGNSMVTATVVYNSATKTVTLTPTTALANSKTYTITVVGGFQGVKDAAGNPLAQNFTSTFTTAPTAPQDTTPPTVTGTSPVSGATSVATSAAVTVTFSEALNATSVTTSTVRLLDGTTPIAATVTYNVSNNTVTITPTAALTKSKTYTISMVGGASGVKDVAGNALAQSFTSTFTTVAVDTTPPTVSSFNPANGATNVATSATITVTFSEAINASTVTSSTARLLSGTTQVAATVTYNASNNTATITPTAALGNSKTYTISILGGASGVKDAAGNALAQTATSTFTTVAVAAPPTSLWPTTKKPGTVDVGEGDAVSLGVKFSANTNGTITGIRFYKSAANTGVHTGSLYSSTGQLLATGTFVNETASGWQTLIFSSPVSITAGTTYVASYFAPNGHFSVDRKAFTKSFTSGNLTVPINGGVFQYGSSAAYPTQSYQASNYYVDVLFTAG